MSNYLTGSRRNSTVAAYVLRKRQGFQKGLPFGVNVSVNDRFGPNSNVGIFFVPAGNKGIEHGYCRQRIYLSRLKLA